MDKKKNRHEKFMHHYKIDKIDINGIIKNIDIYINQIVDLRLIYELYEKDIKIYMDNFSSDVFDENIQKSEKYKNELYTYIIKKAINDLIKKNKDFTEINTLPDINTLSGIKTYYEKLQEFTEKKRKIPTYIIFNRDEVKVDQIIKDYGYFKNILNIDSFKDNFRLNSIIGKQLFVFSYGVIISDLFKTILDVLQKEECSISINKIITCCIDENSNFINDKKIIPGKINGKLTINNNVTKIESIDNFNEQVNISELCHKFISLEITKAGSKGYIILSDLKYYNGADIKQKIFINETINHIFTYISDLKQKIICEDKIDNLCLLSNYDTYMVTHKRILENEYNLVELRTTKIGKKESIELEKTIKDYEDKINTTLNETVYNFVKSTNYTTEKNEKYNDQLKIVELLGGINNSTDKNKYEEKIIMFANYENGNKEKNEKIFNLINKIKST